MKKTLIVGTILLTASLLIGGVYHPNFPLMWLAGTSIEIQAIRAGLIVILGVLLFSNPPRMLYFRFAIAAVAAVLSIATVELLVTYQINLIDAVVFMEIAVIFGIEALEAPKKYPIALRAMQTSVDV